METKVYSESFIHASDLDWENAGDGVRRKILGSAKEIMMVRVEFRKGAVGYLHKHPHRQVTYVDSGRFEVEISGKMEKLSAGDGFIVGPDIKHGVRALEDGCLIDVFTPAREDFLKESNK